MADAGDMSDSPCPLKRRKIDSSLDPQTEDSEKSYLSYCGASALMSNPSINSVETTVTSDSGFNEFTPPHDEEQLSGTTAGSSATDVDASISNGDACNNDLNKMKEDGDDSMDSTASNFSGLSDFSNMSGKDWKPCAGPMSWLQRQMMKGANPRSVLTQILGGSWHVPEGVSDVMLWHLMINMLSEPPRREKLRHINTLEDVVRLLKVCKKIIVLTGAGVSVSCGIPDFRSKDGIYARLAVDFPDLPDPQAMFDINYFRRDPRPFFKFAREIYPGQFTPSLCHKFIRLIEQHNRLLRNYTQNIDTLEQEAGITNVIQCHGSFATATCQRCSYKVKSNDIKEEIFSQRIPKCPKCTTKCPNCHHTIEEGKSCSKCKLEDLQSCSSGGNSKELEPTSLLLDTTSDHSSKNKNFESCSSSFSSIKEILPCQHICSLASSSHCHSSQPIIKPDIVFFGEGLPDEFHDRMATDKEECDLLIVIGSSLKVRPVALIPSSLPSNVPQVLINREPLDHLKFDVELLGDCDIIVSELCRRLGDKWNNLSIGEPLAQVDELPPRSEEVKQEPILNPKDEHDIEALKACWIPKVKESLSERLNENTFLYTGGHRYIFPGAEVYYDPDDEQFSSSSSSNSNSDSEEREGASSQLGKYESHEEHSSISQTQEEEPSSSFSEGYIRRSSQALSEDVDSLLSTPGDQTDNNTPDHPIDNHWTGPELQDSAPEIVVTEEEDPVEDWTNLSSSLDASNYSCRTFENEVTLGEELHKNVDSINPTQSNTGSMDCQA